MLKKVGSIQQKILILCLTGAGLAFSASPKTSFKLLRAASNEWKNINRKTLTRSLRSLCRDKLMTEKRHRDGTIYLELTEAGKRQATYLHIFGKGVKIPRPKKWDKLWRVVMFDIPEASRQFRDIFRDHLRQIGFKELQQSVFIFPYPCEKELAALIDLYGATKYVRILTVTMIDNEQNMRKLFSSFKLS